jgi:hypothetical protein
LLLQLVKLFLASQPETNDLKQVIVSDRTSYGDSKSGRLTSIGLLKKKLKEELKRIGGA